MKKLMVLIIYFLLLATAFAQNGKIVDQKEYNYPDSTISSVQTVFPDIRLVTEKVQFYRITYLSDGLKVKGYLAIPKNGNKYPCIIYNRGGEAGNSLLSTIGIF